MGLFTKPIKSLDDLFVHTLEDIYYAENQIASTLPTMIEKASNEELRDAFRHHLEETKGHVKRLERVFEMSHQSVRGVDCPAIDGIINEAKEVVGDCDDETVRDAAMLSAAQAVEHYEMTRYGTLIAFAKQLGRNDCVSVLEETLVEEKAADARLSGIASHNVNRKAA